MEKQFAKLLGSLDDKFHRLVSMTPVCPSALPREMPKAGIYLFSERGRHLYVGRSRNMRRRLQEHCRPSSGHNSAVFAFLIAREKTRKLKASYTRKGSRALLLKDRRFAKEFEKAKQRIRAMQVRYVEEADALRQALLEIYVAVALKTQHNDFDTH